LNYTGIWSQSISSTLIFITKDIKITIRNTKRASGNVPLAKTYKSEGKCQETSVF
jgi:hypothetical protein